MTITIKKFPVPENGDLRPKQSSPVSTNQDRVKKELPKSLTLYIPENLDLEFILKRFPPNFKYHKDQFVYILHLIIDIPSRRKSKKIANNIWEKSEYGYTELYSSLLQRRVRNYNLILEYLIKNGILISDNWYIKYKKSKGYKFHSDFLSKIKAEKIFKRTLIKSILKYIEIDYKSTNNKYLNDKSYEYITKWMNHDLTIDYLRAKKYLLNQLEIDIISYGYESAMIKFNHRLIVVEKLNRGEFNSSIDNTAGRMHTILTQLKSELRQFVKYNGEILVASDIINSQPYLSTILLNYKSFSQHKILEILKI